MHCSAQLCVTRSKTTPVFAVTSFTPPELALQTQDGPWGLFPRTSLTSPPVTSVTSPHSPATPSNPFDLAADTVNRIDMVMGSG